MENQNPFKGNKASEDENNLIKMWHLNL